MTRVIMQGRELWLVDGISFISRQAALEYRQGK